MLKCGAIFRESEILSWHKANGDKQELQDECNEGIKKRDSERKREDVERRLTQRATSICGGWCSLESMSTTPLFLSLSGASPLLTPPTPPSLLIRLMVTDKQMKIFDRTRALHRDLLEVRSKHPITPFFFFSSALG